MRRVLAHVRMPWNARCLAFTENKRYGYTESHAQVAEPLYRRAVGRYRDYLGQLDGAVEVLRPVMERWDYAL